MQSVLPLRKFAPPIRESLAPLLAVVGLGLVYVAFAPEIGINVDGRELRVRTLAPTVAGVLRDAGLRPEPNDRVVPGLGAEVERGRPVHLRRSRPVRLTIEGQRSTVRTAERHPANILAEAGLRLLPGDRVLADGLPLSAWPAGAERGPERIRLERAETRSLRVDGEPMQVNGTAPTLASALFGAGVDLYEGDRASRALSGPVTAGAELRSSRPIRIEVDGRVLQSRVAADTVTGALSDAGVVLLGLDRAQPGLDEPVPAAEPIRVIRVREEVRVELVPVPFETRYQPLPEVEIDERRIIDTGAYGVQANQVRIRYEDGEEVARRVEGNWLAREAEPRVVGYGSNIVVRTMSTPEGTIEYWRAVEMWATSYSPSRAGVSPDAPNFGITASGRPLEKGLVAIDRSLIPFGTQMYVPGYGFALAADTGSGVKGRWIDLGYEDDNWVSWAQYVTVYFLTPVPPPENITWILP